MSQLMVVNEEQFRELLGARLGQNIDRAICIFINFGPTLSYDVTNIMLHAVDRGKEGEVLAILEEHWEKYLQFQYPRGTVESMSGVNVTEQTFLRICQQILALTPTAAVA